MLYSISLWIHIIAGFAALFCAFIAAFSKIFKLDHRIHVLAGRIFFGGMATVFLTTLILTWIRPNTFLLLIGIFSFYLAFTGWRLAKNKRGIPSILDRAGFTIMFLTSLVMAGTGIYLLINESGNGIILIVFGAIGFALSIADFNRQRKNITGKTRIRGHLIFMMSATIAAITAFLVTNFQTDPGWILWIAPTVVITPLISWMARRV